MANLKKWKPFHGLMKDFFDDITPFFESNRSMFRDDLDFIPKLDIKDTEKELEVAVELPGIDKKDIDVSVEDGVLTISGEKKGEKRDELKGYTYYERKLGRFERKIRLPENVKEEEINADFKNGVLTLTAPKEEIKKAKAKSIKIK